MRNGSTHKFAGGLVVYAKNYGLWPKHKFDETVGNSLFWRVEEIIEGLG